MDLALKILIAFLIGLSIIALVIALFFASPKDIPKESPGVFFFSDDGAMSWADTMDKGVKMPSQFNILKIASLGETMFILTKQGQLWRSLDKAKTWEKIEVNKVVDFSYFRDNPTIIYYLTQPKKGVTSIRKIDLNLNKDIELYSPIVPSGPFRIFTINSDEVFVFLTDGQIIKSSDKGITWQSIAPLKENITSIFYNDKFKAFFVLTKNRFFRSDDGQKYQDLTDYLLNFDESIKKFAFQAFWAQNNIYILNNNELFISQDGGYNFTKKPVAITKKAAPIMGITEANRLSKTHIILYSKNQIYLSDNNGTSWRLIQNPSRYPIGLIFPDENFNTLFLSVIK